ncbi:MAG: hypothetical protein Q4A66_09665, partial [Eubacteriales bacterium]|nr:hypothetical protein [Eubacteriales bacterium]
PAPVTTLAPTPVVTPTPEPTATPKAETVLVPPRGRTDPLMAGEWFALQTELDENGEPYMGGDGECKAAQIGVRLAGYLSPEDFAEKYGEVYQLYGSEAALVLEFVNNSDFAVDPQKALSIAFANKADVLYDSYPLMDAPMGGGQDVTIGPGETAVLYKRFAYDDLLGIYPYAVVTYTVGGEEYRTYILLEGIE